MGIHKAKKIIKKLVKALKHAKSKKTKIAIKKAIKHHTKIVHKAKKAIHKAKKAIHKAKKVVHKAKKAPVHHKKDFKHTNIPVKKGGKKKGQKLAEWAIVCSK